MLSYALDNKSICLDESHHKLAVLTAKNEYEIIDFEMVEDCQLDIQYRKKTCNRSSKKKIDLRCCCDFYLDITLKDHPYLGDVSVCLNHDSLAITAVERANPLTNEAYSKYFRQANEIIDKLIKER